MGGFVSQGTVCMLSAVTESLRRGTADPEKRNRTIDSYRYSVPTPFIFTGTRQHFVGKTWHMPD